MEYKLILINLFVLIIGYLPAQSWEWAVKTDNGAQDNANSICLDKENNIYITGSDFLFTGGGQPGNSYFFEWLYKFDTYGQMKWKKKVAGSKSVTDPDGNTYVLSGDKVFKYNNDGENLWTVDHAVSNGNISLHPDGPIFIAGRMIVNNASTGMIALFDPHGYQLWEKVGDFPGGGTRTTAMQSTQITKLRAQRINLTTNLTTINSTLRNAIAGDYSAVLFFIQRLP